ncbi:MAG: glycosyltransferase family 4 protein [Acidimicrobiia bacterium]
MSGDHITPRRRVLYLVSHPIQYQVPLLRAISETDDLDLEVAFCSDFSLRAYRDPGFGRDLEWDVDLTSGYRWRVLPTIGADGPLTFWRPWNRGVWQALRNGRYDAVWLHGYANATLLRALFYARVARIPVLLRSESRPHDGRSWRSRLGGAFRRLLYRRVDGFLAIGEHNRANYLAYGARPDRIFSVPYAVDNEFFASHGALADDERRALAEELGLDPDRPVILYASKLQQRKRPVDLLEAYKRLAGPGGREPVPYLLFVGDGEERERLESLAAATGWDSIRFLGFRNQQELPSLYALATVFVLPSEREPWGLVVNEVMATGKPVIVTDDVGCAPDLVHDGENGFVVRVGDVPRLAESLEAICARPDLARRMGQASRRIIERHDYHADVEGIREAVHAVVAARDRSGAADRDRVRRISAGG